jgi:hypothetical protein
MNDELKPANQPAAIAAPRRNGRPMRIGGGPPNYVDNAALALAEPLKGITTDGAPIAGLYPIEKTAVSTQSIREAAEAFLASLSKEQRAQTLFPIDAPEWRMWSNIHRTIMRHGMPFFAMTDAQLDRAFALLKESLSEQGFQTARDIIRLNETVMEMTGKPEEFGEDLYWISIMGTPSAAEPWGWQIDGHHLNVNFFVFGDQATMTPAFLGSEPVHALSGKYAGTRAFKLEEDHGLAVMRSLTGEQRAKATISATLPRDVFTTAFRDNLELNYAGVSYDELSSAQHDQLLCLIDVHVGRQRPGPAQVKMNEVKRHLRQTHFAWMGGCEEESVFYYRVHSPVLLIEFDHQAGQAFPQYKEHYRDHIHIIVRAPNGNDYGKDLLRQHYERSRHHATEGLRS